LLALAAEHRKALRWTAVVTGRALDVRLVRVFVPAVAHAVIRIVEACALDTKDQAEKGLATYV
jgi:hypothetical protein